jgi:hypothetical protein
MYMRQGHKYNKLNHATQNPSNLPINFRRAASISANFSTQFEVHRPCEGNLQEGGAMVSLGGVMVSSGWNILF